MRNQKFFKIMASNIGRDKVGVTVFVLQMSFPQQMSAINIIGVCVIMILETTGLSTIIYSNALHSP